MSGSGPGWGRHTPWTTAALGLKAEGQNLVGKGGRPRPLCGPAPGSGSALWGARSQGRTSESWGACRLGGPRELCPEVWGSTRSARRTRAPPPRPRRLSDHPARGSLLPPLARGHQPALRSPRPLYRQQGPPPLRDWMREDGWGRAGVPQEPRFPALAESSRQLRRHWSAPGRTSAPTWSAPAGGAEEAAALAARRRQAHRDV